MTISVHLLLMLFVLAASADRDRRVQTARTAASPVVSGSATSSSSSSSSSSSILSNSVTSSSSLSGILPSLGVESNSDETDGLHHDIPVDSDNNECRICFSRLSDHTESYCPLNCRFCHDCIRTHVNVELEDNKPESLCPVCKTALDPVLVQKLAETGIYDRWTVWQLVRQDPTGVSLFRCPTSSCGNAILLTGPQNGNNVRPRAWTCTSCTVRYCLGCSRLLSDGERTHSRLSCAAFKRISNSNKSLATMLLPARLLKNVANTTLSKVTIMWTTKPCPNCGSRIEKNKGCNHMKCRICRHQFHWRTGRPWQG